MLPISKLPRRPREPAKTTIFGGACELHFQNAEETAEYHAADFDLHMRFYHKQVQRHGIWAGNQGKFVASPDLLRDWDSRHDWDNYQRWLAKQPKEQK